MDFIVDLPKKKSGYKNGLVVVDIFTKMVLFIAMTKMDTERTSNIFVKDIGQFHGLPETIVLDRGSQCVSGSW